MKVHIEPNRSYTGPVKYTWGIFARNRHIPFTFTEDPSSADLRIGSGDGDDIVISPGFYERIAKGEYAHSGFFHKDCIIRTEDGREDLLSTCFYMINCIQEYNSQDTDEVGRFKYKNSYQYKFGNIQENLVQQYFEKLSRHPGLNSFRTADTKTKFFLSHDIDSVNGALLQDGLHLIKRGKFHLLLPVIFNAVIQKPDWLNMDKIMKIEDEYSFKSTFYWLVNKGRINRREVNADYDIGSRSIKKTIRNIEMNKWENGLHKSISGTSLKEEMIKSGFSPRGNRYHYLKFTLPDAFDSIEASGLEMDASIGFPEHYGFRNSYGLPFHPYNLKTHAPYHFLEVPLHIMDGTFQRYMNVAKDKTADLIISFLEKNKYNCLLSVLWHNTFFTDHKYAGYLDIYKKVLAYLYESEFECMNQSDIIREYKWKTQ